MKPLGQKWSKLSKIAAADLNPRIDGSTMGVLASTSWHRHRHRELRRCRCSFARSMPNRPAAVFLVWPAAGCGSCRSFSHVCDTLAAAPHRHLTLCAVPCLVSSVQFSACLVTSPTFVLFVPLFCQQIETKNRLIAILIWRRTYQEADDTGTKKL